jgi:hypothetical protein
MYIIASCGNLSTGIFGKYLGETAHADRRRRWNNSGPRYHYRVSYPINTYVRGQHRPPQEEYYVNKSNRFELHIKCDR